MKIRELVYKLDYSLFWFCFGCGFGEIKFVDPGFVNVEAYLQPLFLVELDLTTMA